MKVAVEQELEKGVLEKGDFSEWATPIVSVFKNGRVHLRGEYEVTVNPVLDIE